jgi:hypothetical protein
MPDTYRIPFPFDLELIIAAARAAAAEEITIAEFVGKAVAERVARTHPTQDDGSAG